MKAGVMRLLRVLRRLRVLVPNCLLLLEGAVEVRSDEVRESLFCTFLMLVFTDATGCLQPGKSSVPRAALGATQDTCAKQLHVI